MRNVVGWFLVAAVCVALCSCKSDGIVRQKTYRVSGKVLVDGKPVAQLRVFANAKEAVESEYPIAPQAVTEDDGSFQLYSYEPGDGVPAGDYALTFSWQKFTGLRYEGPDKLNERYADPDKSKVRFKVENSPVDLGTIELTTK